MSVHKEHMPSEVELHYKTISMRQQEQSLPVMKVKMPDLAKYTRAPPPNKNPV